jgi:hypothetical protein
VITWTHDPEVRRRSYELLAREFNLPAMTEAPPTTPALAAIEQMAF